jgi:hypothetical protein
VIGAHAGDFLGSQVHSGDINGDGSNDLVIGALQAEAPDNQGKTGAVYVIYGSASLAGATIDLAVPDASGQHITTIYGEHALDCAGDSVRTYDINKDGLSDLFIGSPERTFAVGSEMREDAGVTEIIYGQRDFLPPVVKFYDPPAGLPIFRLAGARSEDEFSYRLTGADVDGDGYVDYIANAMHGDGFVNSKLNAGNVYIFSGKKLSAKLGMLPTQGPPAPALTSATLNAGGAVVQEAVAGQNGLSVIVNGTGFTADLQIVINGVTVLSRPLPGAPPGSPLKVVFLDENQSIKNSAGPLRVRVRNGNPPSELSNEVIAGTLVGPEIASIVVKRKSTGLLVLKISGANFPSTGTVQVIANAAVLPLKSVSFAASDFIQVKIKASAAPASNTILHVRVIAPGGVQSNDFTVSVP